MVAALLAAIMIANPVPSPVGGTGRATWYDATRNNAWYTQGGNRMYGAVGNWRWGDTPYDVLVTNVQNGMSVRIVITDYCEACAKGKNLIDLSPQAFTKLGVSLGRGVQWVTITKGGRNESILHRDLRACNYVGASLCAR